MKNFQYIGILLFAIATLWLPSGQGINEVFNYQQLRDSDFVVIAEKINKRIRDYTTKNLQPERIEEGLKKLKYVVRDVNGKTLEENFTSGIENVFSDKGQILQKIKENAETAEMEHSYNAKFEADHAYFNMRDISTQYDINKTISIVPKFSDTVKVNFTNSFVQVPTNVYAYKQSVLDQVTWGAKLDESFSKNFDDSGGELLYQYFGDAATGIFRIYPGNIIGVKEDEHKTDLYDCRRRVWYIQAAASAKDVVIVLDLSGSMIGNNIGIAKIAISSLIDTLQENDYFNVITVNTKVKYLVPCIKYLIQATKENKEMMKRYVQNLAEAKEIVDVNKGMDEAFKILNIGPSINRTSAGCNKAIMFVTDGVEGDYAGKESFERNNKDKSVRVFSYLVGRIKNPNEKALIKMSCDNNGFFYKIETLGNIWDTVLDYIRVMSRPLIPDLKSTVRDPIVHKPTYTPAYLDSAGFGMVMTISLSVFKKRAYPETDDRKAFEDYEGFLGVAGTDISLKTLKDQVDQSKMGVFSRAFVINNNGFVLIHPKFRDQSGYLPVPPNVLIDELESAKDKEKTKQLKNAMLKTTKDQRSGGPEEFITRSTYDDGRKVFSGKTKYWYKMLPDADLVSALALNEIDETYLAIDDTTPDLENIKKDGIKALEPPIDNFDYDYWNLTKSNTSSVTIAPWNYCNLPESSINKPLGMKFYPTVNEIYKFMSENADYENHCKDKELITSLLAMAGVTNDIVNDIWHQLQFGDNPEMIHGAFFATSSGYQKYLSYHNDTDPTPPFNRDILRTKVFETPTANPKIDLFLSSSARDANTGGPVKLSIMRPYWEQNNLAAVTGIEIDSQLIYNYLIESAEIKMTEFNNLVICKNAEQSFCGIIDEHGYIITSNQGDSYTGKFIGERLGEIVAYLPFFTKIELEDAQAECHESDEISSANILLTPAKLIFGFLTGLVKTCFWLVIQFGILFISLFEHAQRVHAELPQTIRVTCTKTMPFYQFDMTEIINGKIYKGEYMCEACSDRSKNYKLIRLNDTNTMLLMAEADSSCCYRNPVRMEHVRKESDMNWCDPPEQPFRRTPGVCLNDTMSKPENAKCGSGLVDKPSVMVLTIAFMIVCFVFG